MKFLIIYVQDGQINERILRNTKVLVLFLNLYFNERVCRGWIGDRVFGVGHAGVGQVNFWGMWGNSGSTIRK